MLEIVFAEDQDYGEAQRFVADFIATHEMKWVDRVDGPGTWLWDVLWRGSEFVFGYDGFPCETVLIPKHANDEYALLDLFKMIYRGE